MNSKTIVGISVAAILSMAFMVPGVADAISDLVKTKVLLKNGDYKLITFKAADKVPRHGEGVFGGYAVFTDGDVIAVTAHDRFFDSETQVAPTLPPVFDISLSAARCADADPGCGGVWHTHLVKPAASGYCSLAKVGALTFQEPSRHVIVAGKNIILSGIDGGDQIYLESLSSTGQVFTAGSPLDSEDVLGGGDTNNNIDGVAFDLNPAVRNGALKAVCIADLSDDPDDLCDAIDAAGGGLAYRNLIGAGGANNKVQLDEFPFSEALWNEINTNTGDVDPEGLGGVELQNWFDANC